MVKPKEDAVRIQGTFKSIQVEVRLGNGLRPHGKLTSGSRAAGSMKIDEKEGKAAAAAAASKGLTMMIADDDGKDTTGRKGEDAGWKISVCWKQYVNKPTSAAVPADDDAEDDDEDDDVLDD